MNPARLLHPSSFILPKSWSGSVSRILFPSRGEDHSSATRVAAVVEQPTRKLSMETGDSAASLFGLAPQGVCHAVAAHAGRGALLPHHFTLASATLRSRIGGLLSVALSVALPRLAASQPAARRSSDFPPPFDKLRTAILRSAPREEDNRWEGRLIPAERRNSLS